jgi:nicotinate-nucleotide pyrophosphorylase (carboxylating)
MPAVEFDPAALHNAETLIELAFAEDLGTAMPNLSSNMATGRIDLSFAPEFPYIGDLTGESTIPANARGAALFVARSAGVVSGLPVLERIARRFGLGTWYRSLIRDGDRVAPGTVIASIAGEMRALLLMERTALNFLQRLSGVASLTARFVAEVAGTKAVILDTRKTTPGWRALEKYAVRCGGGKNHRMGLYDAVLIKDNHLAWLEQGGDPIGRAVAAGRLGAPEGTRFVEVEVDTLEQLDRALEVGPDIILVDNLGPEKLAEAVRRRAERAPGILLEASGGVTLATVRKLAETGVDRISVGALTHSAPALDIGLDFDRAIVS